MNFKDYIRGKRHGKEANQLERKAMNDPFLQDAIDGYDSVGSNSMPVIEKLEKQLNSPTKHVDKRAWIWAAAAVLVLLIGIPIFLYQPKIKDVQIASSENTKQEEIAILLPENDSVLVAKNIEPKVTQESKTIPVPAEVQDQKLESQDIFVVQDTDDMLASEEITAKKVEKVVSAVESKQIPAPKTHQREQEAVQGRIVGATVALNTKLISGKIIDELGEPIIGANVMLKNSDVSTITDIDGRFKLTVPKDENRLLTTNFIGMKSVELPLKENMGDITLKADDMALNEVVVVGYGTQRKSSYAGSVSKAKEITLTFGETEFVSYFKKNYNKNICEGQKIAFIITCYISAEGRPGAISIKENSCPDLEVEIKRLLLGSPQWTQTNRKVTMNIEIE
ncbi:MAG: carboxypeptidase-like regulatory domain-containing protein [Bacteroidia bacterium]|nr:carboxypeptidase-like regulatory domain-containing protein [Bacteroidia bacterium]